MYQMADGIRVNRTRRCCC